MTSNINDRDEKSKLTSFAFSVLVASAVGALLNSLATSIPETSNIEWLSSSLIAIILTIGFIIYIFEKSPNEFLSILKVFVIGLGTMATLALLRFFHYYSLFTSNNTAFEGRLDGIYFIFIILFLINGILLFIHGLYVRNNEKLKIVLIIIGIVIFLVFLLLGIILKPQFIGGI